MSKDNPRRKDTTIAIPRQLKIEFQQLPQNIRGRYNDNFSEFAREAIRYYLERQKRAARFAGDDVGDSQE